MNFNRNLALWVVIGLLIFALFNLFQGSSTRVPHNALAFSDFLAAVKSGEVSNVKIQGNAISGSFRDGRPFQTYAPDDPTLVTTLNEQGVRITAAPSEESTPTLFSLLGAKYTLVPTAAAPLYRPLWPS